MRIPVVIYTLPNCVQCEATKRKMTQLGIEYNVVPLTAEKAAEFKEQGYAAAPIVTTDIKVWSGFRLEKIKNLAAFINSLKAKSDE